MLPNGFPPHCWGGEQHACAVKTCVLETGRRVVLWIIQVLGIGNWPKTLLQVTGVLLSSASHQPGNPKSQHTEI